MDVDSRHLRALVAVVDTGTFTDAAIELGVSQASVSRSVQRLEAILGHRLLERSTRSVTTTTVGATAVAAARRVLAAVEQLALLDREEDGIRVGYAWAALGRHTTRVQRAWSRLGEGELELVQTNSPTAGLLEGRCDVAFLRQDVVDPRLDSVVIGEERRVAVLADDHPLAEATVLRLADFHDHVVALDSATGTTHEDLWADVCRPAGFRLVRGVDEWLTFIGSGRAVGISSEATASQHPRPGIVFRAVVDAPPITVRLAWWRSAEPLRLAGLITLLHEAYDMPQGT